MTFFDNDKINIGSSQQIKQEGMSSDTPSCLLCIQSRIRTTLQDIHQHLPMPESSLRYQDGQLRMLRQTT